jgi:hypothetical protein
MQRVAAPLPLGVGANTSGAFAFYAPDGDVVGFASDDAHPGTSDMRWFHFSARPAALVATACKLAGADITRAQWQRYVGDQPYRHVCS